ncbi:MAG: peroxiredoxin [Labilithrix sp.]|nr:peroxiredoxin [Labilithrix sp.]
MKTRSTLARAALVVLFAAVLAAVGIACAGAVKRPDGGIGLLPAGATAPEVVGRTASGNEVRLSSLRGKAVVVYFYPQDETPGCTKEACAFRDAWNELDRAGVTIIGVSVNSEERHRAFQKKHQLPFSLAADESGAIGSSYGVSKKLWGYDRVTFLVGPDGRVAHVWPDVDPALHAREVVEQAARLAPPRRI